MNFELGELNDDIFLPGEPTNITENMSTADYLKVSSTFSDRICKSLKEEHDDDGKYDGDSLGYRRWYRAVIGEVKALRFEHIDYFVQHKESLDLDEEDWDNAFSKRDRELLYTAVQGTLSAEAVDDSERDDANGVLLLKYFFDLWGAPNLSNTITNLQYLFTIKCPRMENPTPHFKSIERILRDYFPDCGNTMKVAILLLSLDNSYYRSIFDTIENKSVADMPSYQEIKDSILRYYRRRKATKRKEKEPDEKHKGLATVPKKDKSRDYEKKKHNRGQPTGKRRRFCKHCRKWVLHPPTNCWENPKNKHNNRDGKQKKNTNGKRPPADGADDFCPICGNEDCNAKSCPHRWTSPRHQSEGSGQSNKKHKSMSGKNQKGRHLVVDLAATHHVLFCANPPPGGKPTSVETLAGTIHATIASNGTCCIRSRTGIDHCLRFQSAIVSSSTPYNLLSLVQLAANGWDISLKRRHLISPSGNRFDLKIIDGLYCLPVTNRLCDCHPVMCEDTSLRYVPLDRSHHIAHAATPLKGSQLLHMRLCHYSIKKIKKSIERGAFFGKSAKKMAAIPPPHHTCVGCLQGKAKRPTKQRNDQRANSCGDLVHTDIKGPLLTSHQGHRFFIHFTDDHGRHSQTYPLVRKSDAPQALQQFLAFCRDNKHVVRRIRSDNDTVLMKGEFAKIMRTHNIKPSPTPPYDPQAGGRHERILGDLWDHTLATLLAAPHVDLKYWPEVLHTVCLVRNNLLHSSIDAIPSIVWQGRCDDLSSLRTVGSTVYIWVPKHLRSSHHSHARAYVYLGMKSRSTAFVLDTTNGKVYERGHQLQSVEHVDAQQHVSDASTLFQGGAIPDVTPPDDDETTSPPEGGAPTSPSQGGASPSDTPMTASEDDHVSDNEQYMTTDEWWQILETRYGPHDYECCANDNGDNARKADFFSPSRSFLTEFPEPGSNGFLNPEYSRAQEFLNRARRIHDEDNSSSFTAIVPIWDSIDFTGWELSDTIPQGTKLFKNPDGSTPSGTRWTTAILRLEKNDIPTGEKDDKPVHMMNKSIKELNSIEILSTGTFKTGEFEAATVTIKTAKHKSLKLYLSALIENHPKLWPKIENICKRKKHPRLFRKLIAKDWPDWVGITTSYDYDEGEYEVAYSSGEFYMVGAGDVIPADHRALMSIKSADPNPVLKMENRHNIFIPTNSRELQQMPDGPLKSEFISSLATEVNNLHNQNVYKWAPIKKGYKPTKSRAVFDIKWDKLTGLVEKFKCRIVACGYSQRAGIDFSETYASTPKLSTMRYFLHQVASHRMKTAEWDITAAYLHSDLDEEIYLTPPHGMERYDDNGNLLYWKLSKSLYGLRQSGHNWMKTLFTFLKEYGLTQNLSDTSLWHMHDDNGNLLMTLFVHTDDGKIGYTNESVYQKFMSALRAKFNVGAEKQGIDRVFNIKVEQDSSGAFKLSQQLYIEDLMNMYNVTHDVKVTSPMSPGYMISVPELSPEQISSMADRPFLSLLSALLWVARCTRPDLMVSLVILARACTRPNPSHWRALLRVLRYAHNTNHRHMIIHPGRTTASRITAICDASHANDATTYRSISGHYILIDGNVIDYVCKTQGYVTLHSGEAETVAASSAAASILYWQQLISQIQNSEPHATLHTDSTTAKSVLSNPIHTSKMKHIRIKLLFVRELIDSTHLTIKHINGLVNPADILTKPLSPIKLRSLLRLLRRTRGGGRHSANANAHDEPPKKRPREILRQRCTSCKRPRR
ncbi:retrovirus-related Pol polyprotein from transposon [Pseudoscourfieldia marina]